MSGRSGVSGASAVRCMSGVSLWQQIAARETKFRALQRYRLNDFAFTVLWNTFSDMESSHHMAILWNSCDGDGQGSTTVMHVPYLILHMSHTELSMYFQRRRRSTSTPQLTSLPDAQTTSLAIALVNMRESFIFSREIEASVPVSLLCVLSLVQAYAEPTDLDHLEHYARLHSCPMTTIHFHESSPSRFVTVQLSWTRTSVKVVVAKKNFALRHSRRTERFAVIVFNNNVNNINNSNIDYHRAPPISCISKNHENHNYNANTDATFTLPLPLRSLADVKFEKKHEDGDADDEYVSAALSVLKNLIHGLSTLERI